MMPMSTYRFLLMALTFLGLSILPGCNKDNNGTGNNPVIEFDKQGNVLIPYTEVTDTLYYIIDNPVEGATLVPEADEWIVNFDTSTDGRLCFTASENPLKETRSTIITLKYVYNGGETSAQINVIQDPSSAIIFEAPCASGFYYGDTYGTQGMRYYTWLSENPVQGNGLGAGINYCLDIFSGTPENMQEIAAAPGTYVFSNSGKEGTLGNTNCRLVDGTTGETTYFKNGTLVITQEGDGYHYEATFTDSSDIIHRVSYTGPVSLYNTTNPYSSTLTEDYEIQLGNAALYSYFYGTYYNDYTMNWSGTIAPGNGNGDAIQFDLCAPMDADFENGFPTGTFSINGTMNEYTSINGFKDAYGMAIGTWYYEMVNQNMGTRVAPLVSGTLTISKNGTTYSIVLDAKDDAGNIITANWSGEAYISDQTVSAAPPRTGTPIPFRYTSN